MMSKIINFEEFWPSENLKVDEPEEFIGQNRSDLISEIVRLRELVENQRSEVKKAAEKPEILVSKGLWFESLGSQDTCQLLPAIPEDLSFAIYYNGELLGVQEVDFTVTLNRYASTMIRFKGEIPNWNGQVNIGRQLMLDDFEIIPNPIYQNDSQFESSLDKIQELVVARESPPFTTDLDYVWVSDKKEMG